MGFASCVNQGDPFTRRVRDVYGANVVSAPRTGIEPLDTLAVRGRRVEPRGRLEAMLDGEPPRLPEVETATVANLTGVRSAAVDVNIGGNLSASFLVALGVPVPGAEVAASLWKGASGFTFEVRDVRQHQIDIAYLGRALAGRQVARTPATEVFFGPKATKLLLITRTLTSPSFAVRAVGQGGQSVKVAVDGVANLLGKAEAGVSWSVENDDSVSFHGPAPVTFAFAAVPCAIDAAGKVVFGLTSSDLTFGQAEPEALPVPSPVVDEDGLLTFDNLAT